MRYAGYYYAFITIIYIVGIVGMLMPQTHQLFVSLSVSNILLCIGLLLLFHKPINSIFIAKAIVIAVSGFLLELAGVKTGLIFGHYTYTNVLGYSYYNVPLLIGANWFFMVYCSVQMARLFKVGTLATALLSGLFMTAYDIVLEPNAMALNYWQWQDGIIPIQNYIAWFVFGALFSLFYLNKYQPRPNYMGIYLYLLHIVFFCTLLLGL